MKTYDVVAIGDVNIDLIVAGRYELPLPGQEVIADNMFVHIGGGAALFTMALAKLGLKISFNGILGEDYYGSYILEHFGELAVDTSHMKISSSSNTGITIAIHPDRDRSFITYTGSNEELKLSQLEEDSLAQGRHIHLTGYKGRRNHAEFMTLIQRVKSYGATISCDVGWDDTGEWYEGVFEVMSHVDVFFLNESEALQYTACSTMEQSMERLATEGKHVVCKMGAHGAIAIIDGIRTYRSGYAVQALDTTGAGDSFNAGYIYGYLSGMDTGQSLEYGNACGAMSVTAYGGNSGIPDKAKLEHFMQERSSSISDHWGITL